MNVKYKYNVQRRASAAHMLTLFIIWSVGNTSISAGGAQQTAENVASGDLGKSFACG